MAHQPVTRDRSEARFAGVCAALARTWQVDAVVVRVAFVILTFITGGFAVFAYLALWALLPERGSTTEPVRRLLPFTRPWSTATLVVVVVATAAIVGGIATGTGVGALVLIALTWVILRFGLAGRRGRVTDEPMPPPPMPVPTTPFERASAAWQQRLDNIDAGRPADWTPTPADPDPAGLYDPVPAEAGMARRAGAAVRRRGRRTWFGILICLGVVWASLAISAAVGVAVTGLAWAASTLLVLGIALLWSARPLSAAWGRPRLLLPLTTLAAACTAVLLIGTVVGPPAAIERGATTSPAADRVYVGSHTIDATTASLTTDETRTYRVDVGSIEVAIPDHGNVIVRSSVSAGSIETPEHELGGVDQSDTWQRIDTPGAPVLTIEAVVGVGSIEVLP
ncbi:MAG: PspC domain-containing protein [Propioniciclava sp.]|uniref:PspC domain-containing protein n=1 Tax=Propioniciclava sp. TaxID=2038686 RepID=UPI0039E3E183